MAVRLREIDDESAEELLEGTGPVPTGYERVAELLGRLRERLPVEPDDLVVTRMQAVVDQALAADRRRPGRWRKLAVVGAIAGGAVLMLGGLGAAGALPDAVQRPVSDVLGTLGFDAPSPSETGDDAPSTDRIGDQDGSLPDDADAPTGSSDPTGDAGATGAEPAIPAVPADPGPPGDGATPATPAVPATPGGGGDANQLPPQAGGTPSEAAPGQVDPGPNGNGGGHGYGRGGKKGAAE